MVPPDGSELTECVLPYAEAVAGDLKTASVEQVMLQGKPAHALIDCTAASG